MALVLLAAAAVVAVLLTRRHRARAYRRAARAGHAQGMARRGWYLLRGYGVEADPARALVWLRKAKAKGANEGGEFLGHAYQHGLGVARDEGEAYRQYLWAVRRGSVVAPVYSAGGSAGAPVACCCPARGGTAAWFPCCLAC